MYIVCVCVVLAMWPNNLSIGLLIERSSIHMSLVGASTVFLEEQPYSICSSPPSCSNEKHPIILSHLSS